MWSLWCYSFQKNEKTFICDNTFFKNSPKKNKNLLGTQTLLISLSLFCKKFAVLVIVLKYWKDILWQIFDNSLMLKM